MDEKGLGVHKPGKSSGFGKIRAKTLRQGQQWHVEMGPEVSVLGALREVGR